MSVETINELRLVTLLDGRPGHEKQTMGIVRALQAKIPVRNIQIRVGKYSFLNELLQLCRLCLPGQYLPYQDIEQADLLLGTGTRTHLPMLLYKKEYSIPAIICMSPLKILQNRFDLCFVPEHDGKKEEGNIILTVGAPNCSVNNGKHRTDCGLILLGGADTNSHHWDDSQVVEMVKKIVTRDSEITWTISSSPRTPSETVTRIAHLSNTYKNVQFFDYKDTPSGWIEEQYDKNSQVWVTADSIPMIYEAITAGCSVGILPMQWLRENSKFKRNEVVLLNKGLVMSFSSWEQGTLLQTAENELNEAGRCAELILRKWWPESLYSSNCR